VAVISSGGGVGMTAAGIESGNTASLSGLAAMKWLLYQWRNGNRRKHGRRGGIGAKAAAWWRLGGIVGVGWRRCVMAKINVKLKIGGYSKSG